MDSKYGIGTIHNKLPWKSIIDMYHFREMTIGNPVIMGRTTFESMGCKTLRGRKNIVLSTTLESNNPRVIVAKNLQEVLDMNLTNAFVIGGSQIYTLFMDHGLIDYMFITQFRKDYKCHTFFPYERIDHRWESEWNHYVIQMNCSLHPEGGTYEEWSLKKDGSEAYPSEYRRGGPCRMV